MTNDPDKSLYKIEWCIELMAVSRKDAVEQAVKMLLDRNNTSTYFTVTDYKADSVVTSDWETTWARIAYWGI